MLTQITPVTVFATIFSLLSITLSIFEHVSASMFLKTETVIIIKINIISKDLSGMPYKTFKLLQNYRSRISVEISKIIDIDYRLIELLTPIQTKNGIYLTFHIRSDVSQGPQIMELIENENKSGYLAKVLLYIINRI